MCLLSVFPWLDEWACVTHPFHLFSLLWFFVVVCWTLCKQWIPFSPWQCPCCVCRCLKQSSLGAPSVPSAWTRPSPPSCTSAMGTPPAPWHPWPTMRTSGPACTPPLLGNATAVLSSFLRRMLPYPERVGMWFECLGIFFEVILRLG